MKIIIKKVMKGITNPKLIIKHFKLKALEKKEELDDVEFLKRKYKIVMGKELNLDNPQTFNEKLQWLKVYWRDDRATICADKYRVREYVKERGCEEILNELYGVWDNADDIDFDKLPNSFVLKANHGCGYNIFIKDKTQIDIKKIKKELNKMLRQKYYIKNREWIYKGIKPKIIAEKLLDLSQGFPIDYKFFCFDGNVDCVMVCIGRYTENTQYYFFDKEWNLLRLNKKGIEAPQDFTLPMPTKYKEMIHIASKLSKGMPFVRVDLYESEGKIVFGELTFFPDAGFDKNLLEEANLYFGQKINLRGY